MEGQYNLRNPAVKRLMKEAAELRSPTEMYFAQPLEDNLFEWHFTVRGSPDTEFQDGIFHGRIILPPDYPMKPPSIMLLTPNGRFELNKKICLTISGYHPESWQPSWSIRTALLAIIGFMPTHGAGAIGSLDYPQEERKKLAIKSQDWCCSVCEKKMREILPQLSGSSATADTLKEAREVAQQFSFKSEEEMKTQDKTGDGPSDATTAPPPELGHEPIPHPNSTANPEIAADSARQGDDEHAGELRHRHTADAPVHPNPTETTAGQPQPNVPPAAFRPIPVFIPNDRGNQSNATTNILMIFLVGIMIAALIARRLYMANEWRFHEGAGEE